MLEDLAALVRPEHLASVRRQVSPGECVAVYATVHGGGRAVITGPERAHRRPPLVLDDRWHLVGVVEISDDSERTLPIAGALRVTRPRPAQEAA